MWQISEFKDNGINKSLLKQFKGQRLLFLENDFTLNHAVGNFFKWCIENKIEYNVLFNLKHLPIDYIIEQVGWFDVIVFETQWVDDNAKELQSKISSLKDKKTVLECYIHEPTWFYKPKGIKHDVFVLSSNDEDMDEWKLNKLRLNKAIWEK